MNKARIEELVEACYEKRDGWSVNGLIRAALTAAVRETYEHAAMVNQRLATAARGRIDIASAMNPADPGYYASHQEACMTARNEGAAAIPAFAAKTPHAEREITMRSLSNKIRSIEASQTLAITAQAKRMKDSGIDVVSPTAGEPDFPTPRNLKDAAINAIESNFTKYTPNNGSPDLIQSIIKKFARDNNLHFSPDEILVSAGAKQSIFNTLQAVCNQGDKVVFFAPYWVGYPEMVELADATPVIIPTSSHKKFTPDIALLRNAISTKTKAIILNSPGNPSGVVYSQKDFEVIAAIVRETNVYVISDEIYEKIIYYGQQHFSIGSIDAIRDHVITVNGVSKAFAMTGWRLGYAGGPADHGERPPTGPFIFLSSGADRGAAGSCRARCGPATRIRLLPPSWSSSTSPGPWP